MDTREPDYTAPSGQATQPARATDQTTGSSVAARAAGQSARRLIVSADDFGLSAGVNAGIVEAHRHGVLTNASLMVNGAGFEEAVELARATPTLGVGLHLVLIQGRATSPPQAVPALVDGAGMFSTNSVASGFRYFFTPGIRAQLETEISAQVEKFLRTGLALSHVDGHLNVHMHPTVLGILLRLAGRYGIRALRLPREPLRLSLRVDPRERPRKVIESITFRALLAYGAPRVRAAGVHAVDHLFGLHQSGHMTEPYILGLLEALPPGITELYTHASHIDDEARRWRPADYECEAELMALTSSKVRATLRTRGVECITYRDLSVTQ